MIRFGPAGNTDSFEKKGIEAPEIMAWVKKQGLSAFEYQCGKGMDVGQKTAETIGRGAALFGVALSVHSHYYINLSSKEKRRMQRNADYLTESCQMAQWLGADRITVHCGGLSGLTRKQAFSNTRFNLKQLLPIAARECSASICLETMGRVNMLGSLEEVIELCRLDERLIPCIDFGHLNARSFGGLRTQHDFEAVLEKISQTLGQERAKSFHAHFSKIEYGKSGEERHLTFEDTKFGPDFELCAKALAKGGYEPRVICESAGTQAEDALKMKKLYEIAAGGA